MAVELDGNHLDRHSCFLTGLVSKLVCYVTRALSEHLRDEQLIVKHYTNIVSRVADWPSLRGQDERMPGSKHSVLLLKVVSG